MSLSSQNKKKNKNKRKQDQNGHLLEHDSNQKKFQTKNTRSKNFQIQNKIKIFSNPEYASLAEVRSQA